MSSADAVAIVLWIGATMYAIFGGADFGAGFWSLLAGRGEGGRRPRELIDWAIGPVWEANHVWLIFILVVLWTGFATAFEAKGDTGQAITALQQYTGMKPKDAAAWSELAGLQATQAQSYLNDYQNAYTALQLAAPSQSFVPTTGKLAQVFSNPIENAQRTNVQGAVSDLQQKVSLAYNGAVGSWQHVTGLQPKNLNAWFQLAQAAQTAGETTVAVSAYKRYLKLNPSSTSAPQIRAIIKQLSPAPPKKKK